MEDPGIVPSHLTTWLIPVKQVAAIAAPISKYATALQVVIWPSSLPGLLTGFRDRHQYTPARGGQGRLNCAKLSIPRIAKTWDYEPDII